MILAGSIVGSGELIATTRTGAEAHFDFLWLIIIGCIVKVFAQIELGRHAITNGKTSLAALNEIPGPRFRSPLGEGFLMPIGFYFFGQSCLPLYLPNKAE